MAAEGLQIAETGNRPFSLIDACSGVGLVYLRQGEVQRAIPVLERAVGLCQDWHILLLLPIRAANLGLAYVLDGRIDAGLALVERGVEQQVARGRSRGLAPMVAWLSEVFLLTGRLEEARQRTATWASGRCMRGLVSGSWPVPHSLPPSRSTVPWT
jgi:hypothetical protein